MMSACGEDGSTACSFLSKLGKGQPLSVNTVDQLAQSSYLNRFVRRSSTFRDGDSGSNIQLDKIRTPVSFLYTEEDRICPYEQQLSTIRSIVNVRAQDSVTLSTNKLQNEYPNFMNSKAYFRDLAFYLGDVRMSVPDSALNLTLTASVLLASLALF